VTRSWKFIGMVCGLFFGALGFGGCERPDERPAIPGEQAPEVPPGAVPGAGVDPYAWLREGRPILFQAQEWRPVGEPLLAPADRFRRVGEFEGMPLYATAGDDPPHETLFFPLGETLWQPLEPQAALAGQR